jgi:hypothetical protein
MLCLLCVVLQVICVTTNNLGFNFPTSQNLANKHSFCALLLVLGIVCSCNVQEKACVVVGSSSVQFPNKSYHPNLPLKELFITSRISKTF